MSTPKKHHYIPQGLLRNFSFDKNKKKINFIEKNSGKPLSSSIGKVARQQYLYRYANEGPCIEKSFFGEIDDLGIVAIDNIIRGASINTLTSDDHRNLRRFVSAQILRVPVTLKQLEEFEEDISVAFNGDYSVIKNDLQADFLNSILKGVGLYESLLAKKDMTVMFFKDPANSFIIGDVPVIQRNYDGKSTSQLGHSPAIPVVDWDFIALPISPKYLLIYYKKTSHDEIKLLASENNDWQFIQSDTFVYAHAHEQLSLGLKEYHKNCYRYIESIDPEYLKKYSIKFGDKIEVARPIMAFTDAAKEQMRSLLSQASKGE
ncbi:MULTISPECIES: DUF4238 domain-containing protein [unclassified Pseudomonas]|uniref:DUF4238 domain-containing protein n=1 Tax=unclassified Pseudomonas TaxID=196821 RepID=UPI000A1E90C9|nr:MULTISPECIES: DUF4238 domain-containing protein [unclassified Pseudomonas]NKF24852.1 DUF4238 domain-containing protein [Pseudomonas sp. BG5]